jgi:hypothetical protein
MAEPGPAIVRHLVAAYCVQRTVLLLAGHAIDDDAVAIKRLGLWTIVTLRWPLLADWLKLHPDGIEGLLEGAAPADAGEEVAAVYTLPEARRLGELAQELTLDADAVRRFAIPIDVLALAAANGQAPAARARAFVRSPRPSAVAPADAG